MFLRFLTALLAPALFVCAQPAAAEDQAQPRLPTVPLVVDGKKLTAEIADDNHEREMGLMHRKELGRSEGMLFVFPGATRLAFWMKNTSIPLSIAYINPDGVILEIHDMKPLDETSTPSTFDSVLYALEVPQGWFGENGVLAGDVVQGLPGPSAE